MTAQNLLLEYLDYSCFWSSEESKNEQPAIIRRKQLEALLKAFGLTKASVNPLQKIMYLMGGKQEQVSRATYLSKLSNINYFSRGEFLHDRPYEDNHELTDRIRRIVKDNFPDLPEEYFEKSIHIGWLFNDLLDFRIEIYKISYPWGGMMEGFSVGLSYSKFLSTQLKKKITDNVYEIDETLCLVIDPKRRSISKEELVAKYGYPDVDIDAIDREWRIENY